MKQVAPIIAALILLGCSLPLTPVKNPDIIAKENKTVADLRRYGKGLEGEIRNLEFLSEKDDQVLVAVTLRTPKGDDFLVVLEVNYHYCLTHCHERIESVNQRYIKLIN